MYIAGMNVRSHKKLYRKGDVLGNEFSEKDILRFMEMGAVFPRGEILVPDIPEPEELVFLDEKGLRKMKSKGELAEYGRSIGIDMPEEMTKEEMINFLLNHIEEEKDNGEV